MVNVAVAGGTSPTLGQSIIQAILATGKHKVLILSRRESSPGPTNVHTPPPSKYGASIEHVDYTSAKRLTTTLADHSIDTLVSVLKILDLKENISYHTNLLQACQAAGLRRYILSDWSMAAPAHSRVDLLAHKAELHALGQEHMKSAGEKGEHVVECCTIQNGGSLEYFAQGSRDQTLRAGLEDDLMLEYMDIAAKRLVIPCRSKEPPVPARVTMTSLRDIGRFVAASLDLRRGEMTGQMGIAGATCSFDSVVTTVFAFPAIADMALEYTTAEECRGVAAEKNQALHGTQRGVRR
ncbi:hypothetical protein LTR70_005047 [Exophiala xenobiotica]|uniref:NmrA-like domain-containing protein n=1 Tax=Lithohypha guttulata TaxID=1690604 RepID=A0ABR0K8Q8_9EURO|nr:hypothetical protein LTR24_005523 [Lithohypha guttulata]KAK5319294.1 hypothetical protein LTR70_005047 [Exophiala xenobiotica]